MKSKTFKILFIAIALVFSLALSVKIIKNMCPGLKTEFQKSARGQVQHFINSFIN